MFIRNILKCIIVGKSCLPFFIPDNIKSDAVNLTVTGSGYKGISLAGSFKLKIQKNSNLIFIETDKPVYKPGQTGMINEIIKICVHNLKSVCISL